MMRTLLTLFFCINALGQTTEHSVLVKPQSRPITPASPVSYFDVSWDTWGDVDDPQMRDTIRLSIESDREELKANVSKNTCLKKLGADLKKMIASHALKSEFAQFHSKQPLIVYGFELAIVERFLDDKKHKSTPVCGLAEVSLWVMAESQDGQIYRTQLRLSSEKINPEMILGAVREALKKPIE